MKKKFKKIYIEITNVCNLSCNFCPKTIRKPEFMSLELFKKVLEEVKQLTEEITLHLMGEPLLHPHIKEIINLAEENNIYINLTTNGTLIEK
ncbi:MAG: radical SAM protein, partial [Candidatus Woesearchaeota archaeon]